MSHRLSIGLRYGDIGDHFQATITSEYLIIMNRSDIEKNKKNLTENMKKAL